MSAPFRCPSCGADALRAVTDGEQTNWFCTACHDCWYLELNHVHRVTVTTCPGCAHVQECLEREARR